MNGFRARRRYGRSSGTSGGCLHQGRMLSCLKNGQSCVVASENLPGDLARKLSPLGLEKEAVIEVLSGGDKGPYLIRTGETRIVLDWETVMRIPVKE